MDNSWTSGGQPDDNPIARAEAEASLQQRARARRAVANALRSGRLQKRPCWICGDTDAQAHHSEGWERPLEVEWLCRRHLAEARTEPMTTDGWEHNGGGSAAARRLAARGGAP